MLLDRKTRIWVDVLFFVFMFSLGSVFTECRAEIALNQDVLLHEGACTEKPSFDLPAEKKGFTRHVVRKGEWLLKIIDHYGCPRSDMKQLVRKLTMANPHIEDLQVLSQGDVLWIPDCASDLKEPVSAAKTIESGSETDSSQDTYRDEDFSRKLEEILETENNIQAPGSEQQVFAANSTAAEVSLKSDETAPKLIISVPDNSGIDSAIKDSADKGPVEITEVQSAEPEVEISASSLPQAAAAAEPTAETAPKVTPQAPALKTVAADPQVEVSPESNTAVLAETKQKKPVIKRSKGLVPYTVQKGDTAVKILRRIGQVPDRLIFNEYIDLFREANLQVADINSLDPGMVVEVPYFGDTEQKDVIAEDESASADSQIKTTVFDIKNIPPRDLVMSMLKEMGFSVVQGREVIVPMPEGEWLRLDLKQTPIARAPWGSKVVFWPQGNTRFDQQSLKRFGLVPCRFKLPWDADRVFKELERIFPKKIKVWSRVRPLMLEVQGVSIGVEADHIVRVGSSRKQTFFAFNIYSRKGQGFSALVKAYLKIKGVQLVEYRSAVFPGDNDLSTSDVDVSALFTPSIRASRLVEGVEKSMGTVSELEPYRGKSLGEVAALLESDGEKVQKVIHMLWKLRDRQISISVPAIVLHLGDYRFAFVDSKIADPYLVALASLKGYHCFIVKN